eukprot:TRINITY_DN3421_c0_g1_i1.p1 TRINITY_DN3421_c0_g1~~TRINITY_DN3421_c0_g1_i1.p1  ORF type:complete len:137 (-),score=16.52 TRINITY_DN3421_c0_g1_i1:509-919(-)
MPPFGLNNSLNSGPKPPSRSPHITGRDFLAFFDDGGLQLVNAAMRVFVDPFLKDAPEKIIKKVQIWVITRPVLSLHEIGTFLANKVCVVLDPWHDAESWMSTTLSRPNFSSIQGKITSSKMCTYSTVLILRTASTK